MKKLFIILVSLLVIFASLIVIDRYLTNKGIMTKKININEFSEELFRDFEQLKSKEINNYHSEEDHLSSEDKEMAKKNQNPEYVASFLFASAVLKEVDLFSSVFEFEQYNTDLFSVDNPDKYQVSLDMINRITRENKLSHLNVISVQKHKTEPMVTVTLLLFYTDEEIKAVELELIIKGTTHEHGDNIFFVKSSAWEIIRQIEEG